MVTSEFFFPSSSGETLIHVNQWTPLDQDVRGVVQISHGIAEYGGRYAPFAQFLTTQGFAVAASDHLGHGLSRIPGTPPLYVGEADGWRYMVEDLEILRQKLSRAFPGKPLFLFGHSMGSYLARTHLIRYPGVWAGCVLCGTGQTPAPVIAGGKAVAESEIRKFGKRGYSPKANALAFEAFNKPFAPNRTPYDWISVNEANVEAYMADPLCAGDITLSLLRELLEGVGIVTNPGNLKDMDTSLPVLFIAGDQDPVGDMGRGVEKAYRSFQKAGLEDVSIKLYHGLRHEILNEASRSYVFQDVADWLSSRI